MSKVKILVVEDEYITEKVLRYTLKDLEYDVVDIVPTGEEGIRKASETCPDIVLMDITLNGDIDGIEAAKQIRDRFNIPVIYLTAHADSATLERAKITEPCGYILKPFDEKDLQISIEFALYKHKSEKSLKQSEERIRKFIENALDIVVCDINGTIVEWNRSAEKAFNYSKDEIIGKSVTILVPERDSKEYQDGVEQFVNTGEAKFIGERREVSGVTKEGVEIPLDMSITAQKIEEGKYFFTAIMRDLTERKKVEKELYDLAKFPSENPNPVLRVDKNGIILFANNAGSILLDHWDTQISQPLPEDWHKSILDVLHSGTSKSCEVECNDQIFSLTIAPVPEEGYANFYGLDITERKQSEEQIRKLSTAVEQSPNIAVITDVKGKIEYVNPMFTKITGYTHADVIGENPRIWQSGKTPFGVYEELWKTITSGKVWCGELYNKKKNGELFTEYAYIFPLKDDEGVITHFIALKEDITMRKQAERRLNAQHNVTKVLAESTTIKEASSKILQTICKALEWNLGEIWIFDQKKQILCNTDLWHIPSIDVPEFITLTRQITFSSGVGLPGTVFSGNEPVWIADVVHDTDFLRASVAAKEGLHGAFGFPILLDREVAGTVCFFSREIRQPDNDLLNMMKAIGRQVGIFISRKQSEDALLQSEKLKSIGTITTGIAHEFNNILAVISGNVQLLEGAYKDDAELTDALRIVERAANDGAEISSNMLKFTKTTTDTSEFRSIDINDLIKQSIDFTMPRWKNMAQAKGINYHMDTAHMMKDIPDILCNPTELREILLNIINNALDAMSDGGNISFSTWSRNKIVFISISDTGEGISEEVKKCIFDPFFTTRTPEGTGLGLSMAYGIITRHGGKIEVESEVGKGTTFTLQFPTANKRVSLKATPQIKQETNEKNLRILVVDDEEDICKILDKFLSRGGHRVKTVDNGADAIELMKREEFDLVLSDLSMTDVSGYDVINTLNELEKRPKIGIITGWGEKLKPLEENLKVHFIVKKPFNFKELTKRINEAFGI